MKLPLSLGRCSLLPGIAGTAIHVGHNVHAFAWVLLQATFVSTPQQEIAQTQAIGHLSGWMTD